jgi:SAM-dependent methyltransferase
MIDMTSMKEMNDAEITRQNISYYNEIAAEYDAILNKDAKNAVVRKQVADRFIVAVKKGRVLDFGGGTGQDIDWLSKQSYEIIFCEPSIAMRKHAAERNATARIIFLDDKSTDFREWSAVFPFEQAVDAVLANFAVINCIPDIKLFFEKLAMIVTPGGIVMALILDNSLPKRFRFNTKATVQSFFSGKPVSISVNYNGSSQQVYIHSRKAIERAAAKHFELKLFERLPGSGFCLIHLIRK